MIILQPTVQDCLAVYRGDMQLTLSAIKHIGWTVAWFTLAHKCHGIYMSGIAVCRASSVHLVKENGAIVVLCNGESFNHWNGKVVKVTTLWLLASALIVIIEIRGAADSRERLKWLSFSFLKQCQYQWQFMTQFSSMQFFMVHIYLCLQWLIPYSSSPIVCYPVNAN